MLASQKIDLKLNLKKYLQAENFHPLSADGLAIGYCKNPNVLSATKKWLTEVFPGLKATATQSSIDWVTALKAKIAVIESQFHIPQGVLNKQAEVYRNQNPNEDQKKTARDTAYTFDRGQCSGGAGLVGYGLFMQYFPKRLDKDQKEKPRDDWQYLQTIFKRVASIDYTKPLTKTDKQEHERIFSLIAGIQRYHTYCPGPPWQGDWHHLIADTQGRDLKLGYTLGAPVTYQDVLYILTLLLGYPPKHEPRIFLFSANRHDTCLVQYPNKDPDPTNPKANLAQWFFVDFNDLNLVVPLSTPSDLRTVIYLGNNYDINRISPFGLRVFYHNEVPSYPSQSTVLKFISAVSTRQFSDADAKYCEGQNGHNLAMYIGCIPSLEFLTKLHPVITPNRFIARSEVIAFLIKNNYDLDKFDKHLMHTAVLNNDIPLVRLLAKHKPAYLSSKNAIGETPLHTAIRSNFDRVTDALLEVKADASLLNQKGQDAFQQALAGGSVAVMKVFHQHGFTELPDKKGCRPLINAAAANNRAKVELLLDAGVTVFANDAKTGCMAPTLTTDPVLQQILLQAQLLEAIRKRDLYLVKRKVKELKNINMPLRNGDKLAIFAARYGTPAIMKVLIAAGVDIDAEGHRKERALHVASERNDPEMVQVLIDNHASLIAVRQDGKNGNDLTQNDAVLKIFYKAFEQAADEILLRNFSRLKISL